MRSARLLLVTGVALAAAFPAFAGSLDDGKKALAEGRHEDAATAFEKALTASKSDREALLGLAKAASEGRLSDRYPDVETRLREALKAKADDRDLRLALGDVFLAWVDLDHRYRADAQEQFNKVLQANPEDEDGVAGLARLAYAASDYATGLRVLDEFLAKKPQAGTALYWKGFLLYDQATQAFVANGSTLTPEIRGTFQGAYDALSASTKADPKRYDAWVKQGRSAQYLASADPSKTDAAIQAYEKAIALDGDQEVALKYLSSAFSLKPDAWRETLARLAKEQPKASMVRFYWGYSLEEKGKLEEAEKEYRAYVENSSRPARGWYHLGLLLEKRHDEPKALEAFEKALKADPRMTVAADKLAKPLMERMTPEVQASPTKSKALLADLEKLMALSPTHVWLRNDVGFFFRDAYLKTNDAELLRGSVKAYEEGAALVGRWQPDFEQTMPYKDRHQMAQLLNDTGLMFQYHKPVEDLKKAEAYYRAAMEWSQNGYWDTYGNLMKVLEAQQRWQDAYDLALDCAEGLKNEDGSPNETHRATARGKATELEAKLPKDK